jgi:uncharacterized protein
MGCSQMTEFSEAEIFKDPGVAMLAEASCAGNEVAVRRLVADGISPNSAGERGVTPLIWALRCENLAGVKALLDAGADPNQAADESVIPFTAAATIENSEFVRLLLDAGADVNGLTSDVEASPLLRAMSLGLQTDYWDNYYLLLERGADINLAYGRNETTAADRAIGYGRFNLALDLVERGYKRDLKHLRYAVQLNRASEEQAPYKAKLLQLLDKVEDTSVPEA